VLESRYIFRFYFYFFILFFQQQSPKTIDIDNRVPKLVPQVTEPLASRTCIFGNYDVSQIIIKEDMDQLKTKSNHL